MNKKPKVCICEQLRKLYQKGDVVTYVKLSIYALDFNEKIPISRDEALLILGCKIPKGD